MAGLGFPRHHLALLHELGVRVLDHRKPGTALETAARELLLGFHDICMRLGLDGLLAELATANPPLDIEDRAGLADHPALFPALVAKLGTLGLDGGGPRNTRPGLLADAVVAALGLTLEDEVDRTITVDASVKAAVAAALASVIESELSIPRIRESIVGKARELCDERHHHAFDKIAANLDERGLQIVKQPKVPIDSLHAVQRALVDARNWVIDRAGRAAIDRAKDVIARANADAAARIDQPISLRLTPRDVAILRACEARVPKQPPLIIASIVETLGEVSRVVWKEPEKAVRTYAPSQTFNVGDLIEHPKFGRGVVVGGKAQRIEVEFPEGTKQLVHVAPPK